MKASQAPVVRVAGGRALWWRRRPGLRGRRRLLIHSRQAAQRGGVCTVPHRRQELVLRARERPSAARQAGSAEVPQKRALLTRARPHARLRRRCPLRRTGGGPAPTGLATSAGQALGVAGPCTHGRHAPSLSVAALRQSGYVAPRLPTGLALRKQGKAPATPRARAAQKSSRTPCKLPRSSLHRNSGPYTVTARPLCAARPPGLAGPLQGRQTWLTACMLPPDSLPDAPLLSRETVFPGVCYACRRCWEPGCGPVPDLTVTQMPDDSQLPRKATPLCCWPPASS